MAGMREQQRMSIDSVELGATKTETNLANETIMVDDDDEGPSGDLEESPQHHASKYNPRRASVMITENEITHLKDKGQAYPKPKAPVYCLYVSVAIACVLVILIVPAAYSVAARSDKKELIQQTMPTTEPPRNATTTRTSTMSTVEGTPSQSDTPTEPNPTSSTSVSTRKMTTQDGTTPNAATTGSEGTSVPP